MVNNHILIEKIKTNFVTQLNKEIVWEVGIRLSTLFFCITYFGLQYHNIR